MNTLKNYTVQALSECLSPLTHMMKTSGNEGLINRETVIVNGKEKSIPILSGNAIRHRMIRASGSFYLVNELDLVGKLTLDQAQFMFHGGILSQSAITENWKTIVEMQRLFPLYRLLGGSLRNQIISGSLHVGRGVLLCEENKPALNAALPPCMKINSKLFGSEMFVGDYQYTRGDARKRNYELPDLPENNNKSNLMIYCGETVKTYALFFHEFRCLNVSNLEIGALLHSIEGWQNESATFGSQASRGHGRMKISLCVTPDVNFADACSEYEKHVRKTKKEAIEWLNTTFPTKKTTVKTRS